MTEFGLVSVPECDYQSHTAIGHSGLLRIMRSPAHYREWADNPPEPTSAMQFGTAFHAALLEPKRFQERYVVAPKFDRRTKEGKAQAEAWEAENADKTALTAEQMEAISAMVKSVMAHEGAASLLSKGVAEMAGFWTDRETGIECKCRPDFLKMDVIAEGKQVTGIVEVKTCCDASSDGFARAIAALGYDVQAAFYRDGLKALTGKALPFYFVAVEKDPPHAVAVYRAGDEVIEVGRAKYRGALQLLKWCQANGRWPGYQPNGEIETITLPRWATRFDLD